MKKGLLFTLVLMAMVALVIPAGARAPIIQDLPNVIIGDSEDSFTGSQTVYLMRYLNAFDFSNASVIQRQNGYTDDKFHVFYSQDPAEPAQVSLSGPPGTSLVTKLSASEATDLINGAYTPTAAQEVVLGATGYFWASLVNSTINPAAKSAYDMTAEVDGTARAAYPAGSADPGTATLTVYAVESDLPTTLVAVGSFTATSVQGNDASASGEIHVYGATFEGGTDGWFSQFQGAGSSQLVEATPVTSGTGIGFQGRSDRPTATELAVWSTWFMSDDGAAAKFLLPATQAIMGTDIYQVRAVISSTAGSPANSPGYRLFYVNGRFTHMGGKMVLTFGTGDDIQMPSSTTGNLQSRVAWAPPFALSGMADGGGMENFDGEDVRAYTIMFDITDVEMADTGVVAMESIDVFQIPRPAASTVIGWGTSQTYGFNDGTRGWSAGTSLPGTTFRLGSATIGANTVVLNPNNGTTGYIQVSPNLTLTSLDNLTAPWTTGVLTRTSLRVATSDLNASSNFRVLTSVYSASYVPLSPSWFDMYQSVVIKGYYDASTLYGVPTTSGADIDCYAYAGTAGTGATAGRLVPAVDAYQSGLAPTRGWPAETATFTISSLVLQQ
jgi:hypothetical protein